MIFYLLKPLEDEKENARQYAWLFRFIKKNLSIQLPQSYSSNMLKQLTAQNYPTVILIFCVQIRLEVASTDGTVCLDKQRGYCRNLTS